jgi:hypothetical protein
MTEYLIVVALIALAAIGIVSLFGDQIEELISGKPPEARPSEAQTRVAPVDAGPPAAPRRP